MSTAALISPMPTFEPAESLAEHREALARRAAWRLEDASPETIIRWAVRTFGRNDLALEVRFPRPSDEA
jgi:hypothetical protein